MTDHQEIPLTVLAIFLSFIIAFVQLKYQGKDEQTPFQTHPLTVGVSVSSLLFCWLLYGIKLNFPMLYQAYLDVVPIGVDMFGSFSMASTACLLFSNSIVWPILYLLCLVAPAWKIFCWIFKKLERRFGDTQFWRTSLEPVLYYLWRKMNVMPRPMLPLYNSHVGMRVETMELGHNALLAALTHFYSISDIQNFPTI